MTPSLQPAPDPSVQRQQHHALRRCTDQRAGGQMCARAVPRPSVGGIRQMIKEMPSKLILSFVRRLPSAERADAAVPESAHFQTILRSSGLVAPLIISIIIWLIMIICWRALGRVTVPRFQQFSERGIEGRVSLLRLSITRDEAQRVVEIC